MTLKHISFKQFIKIKIYFQPVFSMSCPHGQSNQVSSKRSRSSLQQSQNVNKMQHEQPKSEIISEDGNSVIQSVAEYTYAFNNFLKEIIEQQKKQNEFLAPKRKGSLNLTRVDSEKNLYNPNLQKLTTQENTILNNNQRFLSTVSKKSVKRSLTLNEGSQSQLRYGDYALKIQQPNITQEHYQQHQNFKAKLFVSSQKQPNLPKNDQFFSPKHFFNSQKRQNQSYKLSSIKNYQQKDFQHIQPPNQMYSHTQTKGQQQIQTQGLFNNQSQKIVNQHDNNHALRFEKIDNQQSGQNKLVKMVIDEILDQSFVINEQVPQTQEFTITEHFQQPNIFGMIQNFLNKDVGRPQSKQIQQIDNNSLGQSLFGKILAGKVQNNTNYRKQAVSQFIQQVKTSQFLLQRFIDSIAQRNDVLDESDILSNKDNTLLINNSVEHFIQMDASNNKQASQLIQTLLKKTLLQKALNMQVVNEQQQQINFRQVEHPLVQQNLTNQVDLNAINQIGQKQILRKTELLQEKVSRLESVLRKYQEKQQSLKKIEKLKYSESQEQSKQRQYPLIKQEQFSEHHQGDSQSKRIFKKPKIHTGKSKSNLVLTKTTELAINERDRYENSMNPYYQETKKLRSQLKYLQIKNKQLMDKYEQDKQKKQNAQMKKSNIQRDRSLCGSIYQCDYSRDFRIKKINFKYTDQSIDNGLLSSENLLNFDDEEKIVDFGRIQLKPYEEIFNIQVIKLPQTPSQATIQQQLMILAQKTFIIFGISLKTIQKTITIRKYRNCVLMMLAEQHSILWHFQGRFYFGGWEQNQDGGERNGKGYEYVPYKYVYRGQYKNGKKNGSGKLKFLSSNTVYIGEFFNGLKHGKGSQKDEAGIYEGQWKDGKKDGFGKIHIIDSQGNLSKYSFEGNFQKGLKNGSGVQYFENGDQYKGDYFNGKFHGKGFYLWNTGAKYEGQFKDGVRQGIGKWLSPAGDQYQGCYRRNMKDGFGIYKWKDGSIYQGFFEKDFQNGQGRFINNRGEQKKGNWQNGKLNRGKSSKIRQRQGIVSRATSRDTKRSEKIILNFKDQQSVNQTLFRKDQIKSQQGIERNSRRSSNKKQIHGNKFSINEFSPIQL